jgi:hypothetical protein
MRDRVQRAALRATARIAFGSSAWALGLAGCGGHARSDEPTESVTASGSNSGGASARGPSTGGVRAATGGRLTGDGGARSEAGGGSTSGETSVGEGNRVGSGGERSASGGNGLGSGGESSGSTGSGAGSGGETDDGGGTSGSGGQGSGNGGSSASGGFSGAGGESSGGNGGGGSTGGSDACVGPTEVTLPPTLPGPSDAEFACCVTMISSATKNWFSDEGRAPAMSEPIVNCCRAVVAAVDIVGTRYQQANAATHAACCSLSAAPKPELYQHLLCTPWGPPMPPALDWEAR